MRIPFKHSVLAIATAVALGAVGTAHATNGYFSHGYGTKQKGAGGVGAALPQDSLIIATNPAGITALGSRLDAGLAWFIPQREYTAGTPQFNDPDGPGPLDPFPVAPGTVESGSENFFIPEFGYTGDLGGGHHWGIAVYGNGGLNTDYPDFANPGCAGAPIPGGSATFCGGKTGVDLAQLFIAPTYAYKLNTAAGSVSFGITPLLAYQRFKAEGLIQFSGFSSDDANLTNNGYDDSFGFGGKVGVYAEVSPTVSLGASYQSKVDMDEFDKYKGLFAEQGDFDIPSTYTLGAAFKATPDVTVALDYQRINYTDVDSVSNPFSNLFPLLGGDLTAALGGSNGPGFGWDDIDVWKLGVVWTTSPTWTWRFGYSMGDQPIPDSEVLFNILAPGVMEDHVTFGFTRTMSPTQELNFSAMYSPSNSVTGINPLDGQTLEIKMVQYELGVSYSWLF
jgi:long-chain fatty acid transport protein